MDTVADDSSVIAAITQHKNQMFSFHLDVTLRFLRFERGLAGCSAPFRSLPVTWRRLFHLLSAAAAVG